MTLLPGLVPPTWRTRSTELVTGDELNLSTISEGNNPALSAGPSFHFVLNNTVYKDNRIPPRGYTKAAFDRPGLRPIAASYADGQYWDDTQYVLPATTESIQVMLYYQTASKEYIDFLRANGGSDGATLGKLWDDTKSPPELMALAFYPVKNVYLPFIKK